jgi:hypothetical protein
MTRKKTTTKSQIQKQFVFTSENVADIMEKQSQGFALPRFMNPWFKNQIGVRASNKVFGWTDDEIEEYAKCALDIHYFANNYCKIKSEDGQVRQMTLRDYQYDILDVYTQNRFVVNMSSRQSGKTITAAITILHYCIFNNDRGIMIVANKGDTVIEIIDKIKNIYKQLPFFLKPGIVNWNTKSIVFDNGCRIKSSARSKEPAIGFTIDFLYMDEFAHIPKSIATPYYKAAIPTVSSIKGSKILITSTPNGAGLFKDIVVSSELPEGNPDKGMYKVIRIYWWQVPDGKFDDGTLGSRLDPKLYLMPFEMKQYGMTKEKLIDGLVQLGLKVNFEIESSDSGTKEIIRILHKDGVSDIETVRRLKVNNVDLAKVCNITNWKENEVKLIGGEENFNQEYNIQFIAGSKRVLSAKKAKELEDRSVKYKNVDIEVLEKRLRFPLNELKWHPDFIERERNKYYWVSTLDISEGLGQDYSVINMFRLMVRDDEWLKEHKIKNMYEAFYLKQTGIYHFNRLDHKKELPELYYLLHFEYLDPERCRTVLEINGPGSTFLASIPTVFDGNHNFGNFIFTRYKHNQNDLFKKVGIKINGTNKKELVKTYIDSIESDRIYVDEEMTLAEMENFIKIETKSGNVKYAADSGHDDITMSIVDLSSYFETQDFKSQCTSYYNELQPETQQLIDQALDLNYNPDAISYKGLSSALSKNKNGRMKKSNRFGGGNKRFSK